MKLFLKNHPDMRFEWNAATLRDWALIKLLFINGYSKAYADCAYSQLGLGEFNSLENYFGHEFDNELALIQARDSDNTYKINYLVVTFDDHPVAFIASQLNYKSGRVYIRWNVVAPAFQNQGISTKMMAAVAEYYQNLRFELYTRILNFPARQFYQHIGATGVTRFDFSEPNNSAEIIAAVRRWVVMSDRKKTIYPPVGERVNDESLFVGFYKDDHRKSDQTRLYSHRLFKCRLLPQTKASSNIEFSYKWSVDDTAESFDADLKILGRIFMEAFSNTYKHIPLESLGFTAGQTYLQRLTVVIAYEIAKVRAKQFQYAIAYVNDHPVGAIVYRPAVGRQPIYIESLSVLSSVQGYGIGRQLLTMVKNRFSDHISIKLDTRAANRKAIGFYHQHGFVRSEAGTIDRQYKNNPLVVGLTYCPSPRIRSQ